MAGLDARIPLMAQGIQMPDRVNMLSQAMQLQGLQRQNALADMQMAEQRATAQERNELRNALSRPDLDLDTPEGQAALYRAAPTQAGGILKGRLDLRSTQATLNKTKQETAANEAKAKHEQFMRSLQTLGGVASQGQAALWVQEQVQAGQMGMQAAQQHLAELRDPNAVSQWKQRMLMMGVDHAKQIEMTLPKYERQDTGGGVTMFQMNSLAGPVGAAQGVPTIPKTQSPDSVASNALGWANNRVARDRLAHDKTAPRGVVVQTDQGPVLVDPRAATSTPITGQDGKPLGPKLKDVPAPMQKAMVENVTNLKRAERALVLVEGKNIGDPAKGGMQGDTAATGVKGFLPNTVLNRVDPQGVDARAALADLGSLVIHDRSGAAVSAAEFPRLTPFIPQATDDAETVKKKLRRFVQVYKEEIESTKQMYGPDAGFKPFGGTMDTAAPDGAQATPTDGLPPDIAALLNKHGRK